MGAPAARRAHQCSRDPLLEHFVIRAGVAQRTRHRRPTDGYHKGSPTRCCKFRRQLLGSPQACGPTTGRHELQSRIPHLIEQQIPGRRCSRVTREDQPSLATCHRSDRGNRAGMIGLRCANRDQHIGIAIIRLVEQVLEFADLVAAHGYWSEIVPLDPDLPVDRAGQPLEPIERSRIGQQAITGPGH